MKLEEILANKELAIHRKKSEIHKTDFSNVILDSAEKAFNSGISKIEVLIYEATVSKDRNPYMFEQYSKGYVLNHSVGMRYMKMLFCYDSNDAKYTQEKENFDKYAEMVLNKDDIGEYFWAITEAKNIEGSAVVKGSNFLTPVLSTEFIDENTIKVKCAISPASIIDSHKDVHIAGLWKKSLSESKYDLLLQEHDMDFDKVIVDSISGELKVYTEMISVKELLAKFQKSTNKEADSITSKTKEEPTKVTQAKKQNVFIKI